MKRSLFLLISFIFAVNISFAAPALPYAPAAGKTGSTAIHMDDASFVAWADGHIEEHYGAHVDATWQTPVKALGKAVGSSVDIVSLGDGGQITMTFSGGIVDGDGPDFAIFENSFSDGFLELAWVEVSSDGDHFVRFPNYSWTDGLVGSFGTVDPTLIRGFAGKYRQGYGTPFDLSSLISVSNSIALGTHSMTNTYVDAFNENIEYLDVSKVKYVRITDVVGDGSAHDSDGFVIYDPDPTIGSAGFDLDAVGVIHQAAVDGEEQDIQFDFIPHQKIDFQSVNLLATASSGLPVSFFVLSGPATNQNGRLYFTGTGTVEVVARQLGDSVFAPAANVQRSFIIAQNIQHIFVEPVPDLPSMVGDVTLNAYSSRGLPVFMEVTEGPVAAMIDPTNHVFSLDLDPGPVTIRAYQPGNEVIAPAKDVYFSFNIKSTQPISLDDWTATHSVPQPLLRPTEDVYGRSAVQLAFDLDPDLYAFIRVQQSTDLVSWTNAVPEILGRSSTNMTIQLNAFEQNEFFRLEFEGL